MGGAARALNSAESLRALAMLCRGPMDVATLCEHSGMEPAAVAELLRHPGCAARSIAA